MPLSKIEVYINFAAWTLAVFYSLYNFYLACKIFEHQEDIYNDFSSGWSWIHRKKDNGDLEWQTIIYLIKKLFIWCLIHSGISNYLKTKTSNPRMLHGFHLLTTLTFLIINFHLAFILCIILQPLAFRIAYQGRNILLIWMCMLICFSLITFIKLIDLSYIFDMENELDLYIFIICICWMTMRCFSYFIDILQAADLENIEKTRSPFKMNNLEYVAYCLYLPTLFCGPFISFKDYVKSSRGNCDSSRNIKSKIWSIINKLLRIFFWIMFTEFAMHFIYVNPMVYQIEHVKSFNSWTIYGYGYAMGQYFHLKYVVLYGFSLAFCEFDNIPIPHQPKCIGRIHVYSDMWKYFDRGFYVFLLRYLYLPLMGKSRSLWRQVIASFMCFLFVYIWHGIHLCILIWTAINLFTITVEKIFKYITNTQFAEEILMRINDAWTQRCHAAIAAPLLAISAMSNSYFFADKNIGDAFFVQFFGSNFSDKMIFFTLLYFCGQVGIETRKWEKLKHQK